jgi:YVTN family beta-propeller protein
MGFGPTTSKAVYVANEGSNGVSIIDGETSEVVAGVTFHVKPFGSGRILCDETGNASPDVLTAPSPTEQYIYVLPGTECIAKPHEGFAFDSWAENLEDNSTQLLNISRPASIWDSFASSVSTFPNDSRSLIMKSFQGNETVEHEAVLTITKFGTFTASFKELPTPIPQEYQLLFVSVLLTSAATLVTAWFSSRGKEKKRNDNDSRG